MRNIRQFSGQLPPYTRLLCECHAGSIAEDPARAARLLDELGPRDRFGAIIHTRSQPSELARWFEHLGTRINHAHVFLPRMGRRRQEVGGVEAFHFLESVKYLGSFSIEFVEPLNGPGETAANLFDKAVADMRWLREAVGLKG